MTGSYLRNTTPDYLTGEVFACESIKGSLVLLNGPLGCRFYHSYGFGQNVVQESGLWQLRGELELKHAMDDHLLRSQYFAGTPRIPGSNLRYEDNIFGTWEQLERALRDILSERAYTFLAVLQTPGTSLLGEALEQNLSRIAQQFDLPFLFLESPQFSANSFIGYDETMVKVLQRLISEADLNAYPAERIFQTYSGRKEQREAGGAPKVNLFGLYTYEKFLEGDLAEITRLLNFCGIEVSCAPGSGCTVEELRKIPEADLNVLLAPERCDQTVCYLESLDLPILDFGCMPVGFDLTEQFVKAVAGRLGADPAAALAEIEKDRARAFYHMAKHFGNDGFPKNIRYAIEGEASLLYAWTDFLSGYLGARPVCIHLLYRQCGGSMEEKLRDVLKKWGVEDTLETDITKVENAIVFGSGNTIMDAFLNSKNLYGVEIANPSAEYLHVVPKMYIGSKGALYILEQMLNGARMLEAWD